MPGAGVAAAWDGLAVVAGVPGQRDARVAALLGMLGVQPRQLPADPLRPLRLHYPIRPTGRPIGFTGFAVVLTGAWWACGTRLWPTPGPWLYGTRYCLGASLARMERGKAFAVLIEREFALAVPACRA